MENLKRPSLDETDESLLEEQRKYFEKVQKPSVKYVSKYKKISTEKAKTEEINWRNEETQQSTSSKQEATRDDLDILSDDIILEVKERDVSFAEPFVFQPPPTSGEINQKMKNLNIKLTNEKKAKNKSIFAQRQTSAENQSVSEEERESKRYSKLIDGSDLKPETSQTEILKIHEENLAKLSSMSVEEILHEQQQLKMLLSNKPEILDFIKKKKETKESKSTKACIQNVSEATKTAQSNMDLPGEILRKEGKEDCDALILGKAMESENDKLAFQETDINSMSRKTESSSNFEIPQETKELIDCSNKGSWRNMNKVEKEKLEWMTNLPQPKPVDLKAGYTARFDFQGKLLSRDADIPTYEGLHHHGDEPEVPGYSLEELFLLSRSSVQAQRIKALNTIAHILENNWRGLMDRCFDAPLLPLLLNAGLVPLLRWALDDTSITSVSATISAIHSLLISQVDEDCSNNTFCWLNGHFIPQLEPQGLEEPNVVIEELTDADLIKLDVIKGFLRVDILPRFMYILKVMCPPPLVCKLMVEICARLAQHSPESAKKVATYPDFLNLIFEKFMPLNWHFVDSSTLTDTVGYSCPMPSALKLIRIIISSSKELASEMIEKYDILSIVTFYLSVQPCDGKLPPHEVQLLAFETLKTWHSFLCFGFGFSVLIDLFSNFLNQLQFCLSLNLNCDINKHKCDFDYATHLFKSLEAVAVVAADNKEYGQKSALAMNTILKETLPCLKKWLWQFSQEGASSHGMTLLAACMNFIVTYCQKSHEGLICENWEPCSAAKIIFEKYLLTTLKSNIFRNLLCEFRSFSLYLCPELTGNKRDGKTIVSLGSILHGEDIIPILKEGSPLPLLTAVLNYILFYKNSFQDTRNECVEFIFCNAVMDYLKAVSTKRLKSNCWFLKFETYYIYQLVKLASLKVSSDLTLCHETAISILPAFTLPEECLVEDLFENIIFSQSTILNLTSLLQSSDTDETNTISLLTPRLPVIAQCYISCFLNKSAIDRSRNVFLRNTNIDSLFFLSTPCSLVPKDWCFMPIFYLYQKAKMRIEEGCLSPEGALQVICCLQWVVMGHLLNLPVLKVIPAAAKFYYLCSVFLLDENLFREEKVKDLLIQCCSLILKTPLRLAKINWNGIKNFDEMYLELLIQYEAVSYGDTTFGNFLVIPLQQCYPKHWKTLLLTEHLPVLGFLRVSLSNLLVPLQNFLEPVETDIGLLLDYLKALASGSLDHRRCPLVYLMAVHHIHNFIFNTDDSHLKDRKELLLKVSATKEDLKKKILGYLEIDVKSEYGFTIMDMSPDINTYVQKL